MESSSLWSGVDICVGTFYLVYAFTGIMLHIVEILACIKLSSEFNGFRFIAHHSAADILLLFQYGIWQGIIILTKNEITTPTQRRSVNVFINFTWWSSNYLSIVVTLTRLLGIIAAMRFLQMSISTSNLICISAWVVGLVQSYLVTLFPWYSGLYFNANGYGLTGDWAAYSTNGTQTYYFIFNGFTLLTNLFLYIAIMIALIRLLKRRQCNKTCQQQNFLPSITKRVTVIGSKAASTPAKCNTMNSKWNRSIEFGLLLSCFVNWFIAVIGQVFINWPATGGNWRDFSIMVAFMTQCWTNTLMRLFLSVILRKEIRKILAMCFSILQLRNEKLPSGAIRVWTLERS